MTTADALNILANASGYEVYNLARPSFRDDGDGKVTVVFHSARADKLLWGQNVFTSMSELTNYCSGYDAARALAAYEAKQAEQAQQPSPAAPQVTSALLMTGSSSAE